MSTRTKNIIILSTLAITVLFFFVSFGSNAFAQIGSDPGEFGGYVPLSPLPGTTGDGVNVDDPAGYFTNMLAILIGVAGVLAVIAIMVYGLQYMLSTSEGKKSSARAGITGVVFGLFIIFLSYVGLLVINPDLLSLRFFDRLRGVVGETVPDPTGARQLEFLESACGTTPIVNNSCRISADQENECFAVRCSVRFAGGNRECYCPNASTPPPGQVRVRDLGICVGEIENNRCQISETGAPFNMNTDENAETCRINGCEFDFAAPATLGGFTSVFCDCSNALPLSQQERFCSVSDQQFGVSYPDLDSCEDGRQADVEVIGDEITEKEKERSNLVLIEERMENEQCVLTGLSGAETYSFKDYNNPSDDDAYETQFFFTESGCDLRLNERKAQVEENNNRRIPELDAEIENLNTEKNELDGSPCESGEQCNQ